MDNNFKRARYKLTDDAINYLYDVGYTFSSGRKGASNFKMMQYLYTNTDGILTVGNTKIKTLSKIPKPHVHKDLMVAYAEDYTLEFDMYDSKRKFWYTLPKHQCGFHPDFIYRIRPSEDLNDATQELQRTEDAFAAAKRAMDDARDAYTKLANAVKVD